MTVHMIKQWVCDRCDAVFEGFDGATEAGCLGMVEAGPVCGEEIDLCEKCCESFVSWLKAKTNRWSISNRSRLADEVKKNKTLNQARKELGLAPLSTGDMVLDPEWIREHE